MSMKFILSRTEDFHIHSKILKNVSFALDCRLKDGK